MNNTTDNTGVAATTLEAIVQETFEFSVQYSVATSNITLLVYTIILNISQEIEYMWSRLFSLPTFLYILTRYTPLIGQGLALAVTLLPTTAPILSCDVISYTEGCARVLGYIGVQGLLVTRAYSLCRGNKIIIAALAVGFLVGLVLNLLLLIIYGNCLVSTTGMLLTCELIQHLKFTSEIQEPAEASLLDHLGYIDVITTDFLVFGVCFYSVWDTWRLQRNVRLQSTGGVVSILLKQIISRFFFTVAFTLAVAALQLSVHDLALTNSLNSMQQCLSSILLSGFTLELRQRNSAAITANNICLRSIRSVPHILQHIHQSFLLEMGDCRTTNAGEGEIISIISSPDSVISVAMPMEDRE